MSINPMSTGDVIALLSLTIAIVLGVNGTIIGIWLWLNEKQRKKLNENVSMLEKHMASSDSMMQSLVEWMVISDKISKVEESILINTARQTLDKTSSSTVLNPDYLKRVRTKLSELGIVHEQRRQELMLHSSNRVRRDSAYKHLALARGTIESLGVMNRISEFDEDARAEYLYLRKHLVRRLDP